MVVADARLESPDIPGRKYRDGHADGGGNARRSPDPTPQRRVGLGDLLLFLVRVVRHHLSKVVGQPDNDISSGNDVVAKTVLRGVALRRRRSGQSHGSVPVVLHLGFEPAPGGTMILRFHGV